VLRELNRLIFPFCYGGKSEKKRFCCTGSGNPTLGVWVCRFVGRFFKLGAIPLLLFSIAVWQDTWLDPLDYLADICSVLMSGSCLPLQGASICLGGCWRWFFCTRRLSAGCGLYCCTACTPVTGVTTKSVYSWLVARPLFHLKHVVTCFLGLTRLGWAACVPRVLVYILNVSSLRQMTGPLLLMRWDLVRQNGFETGFPDKPVLGTGLGHFY